jgi:nitrile hydratase subunit beta
MSAAATSTAARFQVGDKVVIGNREAIGHCRTPWYVRGKTGVVVEIHGAFRDPERLAYHRPGLPALVLYKVRVRQRDLWPDYSGGHKDNLEVDIYEPWLAAAAMPATAARKAR